VPGVTIQITLYASLKSLLPQEARGRAALDFPDGTRVKDVIDYLSLPGALICVVNNKIEPDRDRLLADGDAVQFLRPSGGG
jgi:molybdopterin converting factor small subunit